MTMYLPNPDVHRTGCEPAEFIEVSPMAHAGHGETGTAVERRDGASVQLSPQARIDITWSARDYITKLVAHHGGDREDVRSIIDDLHDLVTVTDQRRAR
jgi:hypothetical protein